MRSQWLERLLENVADRGRELLPGQAAKGDGNSIEDWCRKLLIGRGEASSIAIARDILAKYAEFDDAGRERFFEMLYSQFGPEARQIS